MARARAGLVSQPHTLCNSGSTSSIFLCRYARALRLRSQSPARRSHTLARLEHTLSWFKDNRVKVVSLDEAIERLARSSTDKFCVCTFDDGYIDNLTVALPVMERFDAPITVYVTTGMITGEINAWWLGLTALIRGRDRLDLPEIGYRFDCMDQASKKRTLAAINALVYSSSEALAALKTALAKSGIDCEALVRAEGLRKSFWPIALRTTAPSKLPRNIRSKSRE
jgi:Polysaccharide deacetylase